MVAASAFFILCGVALVQGRVADSSNPTSDIIPNALPSLSSTDVSFKSEQNAQPKSTDPGLNYLEMQEQFDIISLCTELPFEYNQLLQKYLKLSTDSDNLETVQEAIELLKSESSSLKSYVNTYAKSVHEMDPNADSVRRKMVSGANGLSQSLEKLYANLAENPQMGTAEKIAFVQSNIKPAIMDFEEGCLSQTKDILKNVIDSLQTPE